MSTIRDIASLARVSPSTVSRFLNGHISVQEETRRRIEEAVHQLDYKPNYLARSLVLKETQTIGVVVPDILNPYYSAVARGVEDEAQLVGWSVVLCNSDNRVDKELDYLRILEYKHVDGIILVSSGQSGEHLQEILRRGIHLVLASRRVDDVDVDAVAVANAEGAREATRHLISLGHRLVATITGNPFLRTGRERLDGYRQALLEASIPLRKELITSVQDFQYQGGSAAMMRLLDRSLRPTAVFAANDLIAIGAISTIQAQGMSVPRDVAVVGFDGIPVGEMVRPRLTTMSVRPHDIGKTACRLLLDRVVRGLDTPSRTIIAGASLVIRESCGATQAGVALHGTDTRPGQSHRVPS